jgi:iron-sulfur cluster repair protein YtfE (RIC family)
MFDAIGPVDVGERASIRSLLRRGSIMDHFDFSPHRPRSAWFTAYPESRSIIDPSGAGDPTIAELAQAWGMDSEAFLVRLARQCCLPLPLESARDWGDASINELVDHLSRRHHPYLVAELSRLLVLIRQPGVAPAALVPRLKAWISGKLAHIEQEEDELFPLCRSLSAIDPETFSAERALRLMYVSHEQASVELAAVCEAMAEALAQGEADPVLRQPLGGVVQVLNVHLELENAMLLPAVIHAGDLARSLRLRRSLGALQSG